jgi:hypothetical protein
MSFLGHIQCYHSHADPIWPDGTFKGKRSWTFLCQNRKKLHVRTVQCKAKKCTDVCAKVHKHTYDVMCIKFVLPIIFYAKYSTAIF